jgi:hypothetical protein
MDSRPMNERITIKVSMDVYERLLKLRNKLGEVSSTGANVSQSKKYTWDNTMTILLDNLDPSFLMQIEVGKINLEYLKNPKRKAEIMKSGLNPVRLKY